MTEPVSSEKRILKINPELFSLSGNNTTRRKRNTGGSQIRVKDQYKNKEKTKNNTLNKKMLLRLIRQQQEKRNKQDFDTSNTISTKENQPIIQSFENEFQEATKFMENLEKYTTEKEKEKNRAHTLKNHQPIHHQPILQDTTTTTTSAQLVEEPLYVYDQTPVLLLKDKPYYSNLKNGSLPTYRTIMANKTQKNTYTENKTMPPSTIINTTNLNTNHSNAINIMQPTYNTETNIDPEPTTVTNSIETRTTCNSYIPSSMRQKRIRRITYKVGKSLAESRISVLVSNKTIRNSISSKARSFNDIPITKIKKYLLKKGFIRAGSTAPNDVLRKMYESTKLFCGDLVNHNPDNLLYNFIHND
jgi:hypothetical protein